MLASKLDTKRFKKHENHTSKKKNKDKENTADYEDIEFEEPVLKNAIEVKKTSCCESNTKKRKKHQSCSRVDRIPLKKRKTEVDESRSTESKSTEDRKKGPNEAKKTSSCKSADRKRKIDESSSIN